MKVKLTYFKESGKYYSDGEYDTKIKNLFDIWDEVRQMLDSGIRPGLCDGANEFIVSVDVPDHEHNHPKLII